MGLCQLAQVQHFAKSAARALVDNTSLSAKEIVQKSLNIAADICVFTNHNLVIESLDSIDKKDKKKLPKSKNNLIFKKD